MVMVTVGRASIFGWMGPPPQEKGVTQNQKEPRAMNAPLTKTGVPYISDQAGQWGPKLNSGIELGKGA